MDYFFESATNKLAFATNSWSISYLPSISDPIAEIWVPGKTSPFINKGDLAGVVVTIKWHFFANSFTDTAISTM